MEPALLSNLVPVMSDGAGNHYCLNTSVMQNGECPVIFWDHEQGRDQNLGRVAASFDVWLIELPDELMS